MLGDALGGGMYLDNLTIVIPIFPPLYKDLSIEGIVRLVLLEYETHGA